MSIMKEERFKRREQLAAMKVYCVETEKLVEKLNIMSFITRDEMVGQPDEPIEYHHIRLTWYVEHSIKCTNNRCTYCFCYSFKHILPHYNKCLHVDCRACNVFNVLLWDHVRTCEKSRCEVPGCMSVCRAIDKNQEEMKEWMEPCCSGYSKAAENRKMKRRRQREAKKSKSKEVEEEGEEDVV